MQGSYHFPQHETTLEYKLTCYSSIFTLSNFAHENIITQRDRDRENVQWMCACEGVHVCTAKFKITSVLRRKMASERVSVGTNEAQAYTISLRASLSLS